MQIITSSTPEQVQAITATSVVQYGGTVTSSSPAVTTATFPKKFSWLWFVLLLGVVYLLWWAVSKKASTLSVSAVNTATGDQPTHTIVDITAVGKRAVRVAGVIGARITA